MARRSIIIDCDPGQDDAINLLLAMSPASELDILGITAVAGNVPLALTTRNALLIRDIAGREDIPLFAGCANPLQRSLVTAEHVHGASGLDGVEIVTPRSTIATQHAVDFIIETLHAANDGSVSLVPTGPLTNIAAALQKDRAIVGKIGEIVLMGGALREGGNFTPSAEFNILVDPHAADIVFRCGAPVTVLGLDATYQVPATPEFRARVRGLNTTAARAAAQILDSYSRNAVERYGMTGAPLHDPCTVAFLLEPTLFEGKHCNLSVETESELTMGHTAVDFWRVTGRADNVNWIHRVDAAGVYDLLIEHFRAYDVNR